MKTLYKRGIRVIGAICCMICMMFMLCTGAQYTYAENSAEIVAVSSTVEKGGTAKVSLSISNNTGIWGLKFQVGYNHDAMTLKSVAIGNVYKQSEVMLPESLDKDKFVFYATGNELKDITTNGTLAVLEFQLSDAAGAADYPISLELIQCINVNGDDVTINMTSGTVTVVNCLHSEKEWKVTAAASCETKGTETEICKKCGQTFGTKEINATGHKETVVKNAVKATESKEGYTGDTYCKVCDKLIKKGTVIAKVETPVCSHSEKVWKVTTAATCETKGLETQSCKSCGKVFGTKEIDATGHKETVVKNAVEATETTEGYTGDIHCVACDKLIEKGTVIEKVETPTETETQTETETEVDKVEDKEPSSPLGGIVVVLIIIILIGILGLMYIKYIKKGR